MAPSVSQSVSSRPPRAHHTTVSKGGSFGVRTEDPVPAVVDAVSGKPRLPLGPQYNRVFYFVAKNVTCALRPRIEPYTRTHTTGIHSGTSHRISTSQARAARGAAQPF